MVADKIKIPIEGKIFEFQRYLEDNPRGILDAKFGNGKTTFLKEFIAETKEVNYCITLRPINYSVATNADIFEYIKRDILLQLDKDNKLDIVDFKAIFEASKDIIDYKEIIKSLLSLFPVGKVASKILDTALEFKDKYKEFKDKYEELARTVDNFESIFINQRGGLYENDCYTKLIQDAIAVIPQRKILIIEDLDRLDPAHLFRVLNVFGAHIDLEEDSSRNKFGFDNIVIVMDYEATESIFKHYYGDKANYSGYISKFMTCYPFNYDIHQIAIDHFISVLTTTYRIPKEVLGIDLKSISQFRRSEEEETILDRIYKLSIRDIQSILKGIESQFKTDTVKVLRGYSIQTRTPMAYLLAIMVRMKYPLRIEVIDNNLHESTGIYASLLDSFLLNDTDISAQIPIKLNNQSFYVCQPQLSKKDDKLVTHCAFIESTGAFPMQKDLGRVFRKSLELTMSQVITNL